MIRLVILYSVLLTAWADTVEAANLFEQVRHVLWPHAQKTEPAPAPPDIHPPPLDTAEVKPAIPAARPDPVPVPKPRKGKSNGKKTRR